MTAIVTTVNTEFASDALTYLRRRNQYVPAILLAVRLMSGWERLLVKVHIVRHTGKMMAKCEKCSELHETPILYELLRDWFKMDAHKVMSIYHKKGHKIFD